jgi:streptogramin lyase
LEVDIVIVSSRRRKMKRWLFYSIAIALLSVAIGGVVLVNASSEEPVYPYDSPYLNEGLLIHHWHSTPSSGGPSSPTSIDLTLGEPGTNYSYVRTFGETEVAYFEDTSHVIYPYGVGTDGTSVWIADQGGNRAMKFANNGVFEMQIGVAGFVYGVDGQTLGYPIDVEVDNGGNVWIVDYGAHHILKFDASGDFVSELGEAWNNGSGNDQFDGPRSIAFDSSNNIYIGDVDNHRVQIFESDGTYLTTLGETGVPGSDNYHFDSIRHIAIDDSDYLYVGDAGNFRVQIYDVSAVPVVAHVGTLGETGVSGSDNTHFAWPMGVAIDSAKIYVADNFNHRVQVFDRSTHIYQFTVAGTQGSGSNELSNPCDVAVDTAGYIFVADTGNSRVQQFNNSGTYVRTYGTTGVPYLTDDYHYHSPAGVAVSESGNIYLLESEGSRLIKLNSFGEPQWTIGEPYIIGADNAHFSEPQDVVVDSTERVYVADTWNNRVQIFSSTGGHLTTLGTGGGDGEYEFDGAHGVAIGPGDTVYVADISNHRVQIYDSSLVYQSTLGETGVSGSDNVHFDDPVDIHVDAVGKIYVADRDNHRVQVYDSDRNFLMTIGETGVSGEDYGHLDSPQAVTVDGEGRIFVADDWGSRVQVFDRYGAYLTTIGAGWGSKPGEMREIQGLAVDSNGDLYMVDWINHHLRVFSPGVPRWEQVNINGFGDNNNYISTLDQFGQYLYAGTWRADYEPAEVWRSLATGEWENITPGWTATNGAVFDAQFFLDHLYVGSGKEENGGEIWRTNGLTWEQVVPSGFGDGNNTSINAMMVFANSIYAATGNDSTGTEIWRSNTGGFGTWTQVNSDGFGGSGTQRDISMDVYDGYLYVGLGRGDPPVGELWRTNNGTNWSPVFTDGLGNSDNTWVSSMEVFNNEFYIGLRNVTTGGEVYRSSDGTNWTPIFTGGLGNTNNHRPYGLITHNSCLYLVFVNLEDGAEVWYSCNGTMWQLIMENGWGESLYFYADYFDKSASVYNNKLHIGTLSGGKIWRYDYSEVFIPLVIR